MWTFFRYGVISNYQWPFVITALIAIIFKCVYYMFQNDFIMINWLIEFCCILGLEFLVFNVTSDNLLVQMHYSQAVSLHIELSGKTCTGYGKMYSKLYIGVRIYIRGVWLALTGQPPTIRDTQTWSLDSELTWVSAQKPLHRDANPLQKCSACTQRSTSNDSWLPDLKLRRRTECGLMLRNFYIGCNPLALGGQQLIKSATHARGVQF